MFVILVIGFALALAVGATCRAARYGASGMTAGMAAMMAAMGTGLAVGYAAGMLWHLGWANLAGVLAGGVHGLWMGRRWGPMAALDGAGGGVMGGLMGPMLAVMLLYLPTSLVLTAILMLALQLAFSAGALYLVAAATGAPTGSGWLGLLGRALGAEAAPTVADAGQDHYAALGVPVDAPAPEIAEAYLAISRRGAASPERAARAATALAVLTDPVRRARYDAARLEDLACCPPQAPGGAGGGVDRVAPGKRPRGRRAREEQARREAMAARAGRREALKVGALVGLAALALFVTGRQFSPFPASAAASPPFAPRTSTATVPAPAGAGGVARTQTPLPGLPGAAPTPAAGPPPASGAPTAPAGPAATGAVQEVALTLKDGRYEPGLVDVQVGAPVRLTIKAVGDPG